MSTVIRELKDGGFSPCNSPIEKVGKGRCNHVIGHEGHRDVVLIHEGRNQYSADVRDNLETKEAKVVIAKFVNSLPPLPQEKKDEIKNLIMSQEGI